MDNLESRIDSFGNQLQDKCGDLEIQITALKDPLHAEFQDIKQEKQSMARELEKIYNNQRELEILRSHQNASPTAAPVCASAAPRQASPYMPDKNETTSFIMNKTTNTLIECQQE